MNPRDPRAERNLLFGRVLFAPLVLVAVTAAAGMVLDGTWERRLAWVTIAVLVTVPIARVIWLVGRWSQRGDRRFVAAGIMLLAVIAVGVAVAAW